ncbi:Copper amine oxidase N-terminal domain-containing protein [Sporobacter termitidis DSM 10068]|uniref:Copper amine oxidase N-terminal domain-containing protein n=1 Tax=Sporobacter termitidis DSM 10068 TaxID=1123282 RepID=A0A1M5Z9J2_9FIRM|nr:stalk domain-containing protein [Sporobacter termitidis]SHI20553.1 Copper amine oxidase N-terminal domain-containing protein [Sporobacter termitidis DSM 10068]
MRKKLKIFTALTLSIVMTMSLLCAQAFAADTKTVQVNGYPIEELSPAKPQLEINNVTSTLELDKGTKVTVKGDDGDELWTTAETIDAAYNAAAPVTIKTLDDAAFFDVYKLHQDGNIFAFDFDESIKYTSGQVEIEDINGNDKTIDAGSVTPDDYVYSYLAGCTVTLTEPGTYYVEFQYDNLLGAAQVFINVGGNANENPTTPKAVTATPAASKIIVDGTQVSFDAYVINENNYIKLRDFAKAVNGSEKQFEVTWDGENNAIRLTSRTAYTLVGGELAAGDGKVKDAVPNASKIIQDGTEIALTAYTIGENNYFKLRDLAKAFNIGVTWDGATGTVGIDTTVGYTE